MSIDQDLRVGLAAELEVAAPGARLVALLEGIEPAMLTGGDLATYVHARWRAHNHAEAQLLEALHQLGRAEAGRTDRRLELDEFSGTSCAACSAPLDVPGRRAGTAPRGHRRGPPPAHHRARARRAPWHRARIRRRPRRRRPRHDPAAARRRVARGPHPTATGTSSTSCSPGADHPAPAADTGRGGAAPRSSSSRSRRRCWPPCAPLITASGRPCSSSSSADLPTSVACPHASARPTRTPTSTSGPAGDRAPSSTAGSGSATGTAWRPPAGDPPTAPSSTTRSHALGGPTSSWNLGASCTHDHRAKHQAGWRVSQPTPGRFVIRTRAGVTHTTTPERIIEHLPAPRPAIRPWPLPDDGWPDDSEPHDGAGRWGEIASRTAARPALVAPASTAPLDLDDPPPF